MSTILFGKCRVVAGAGQEKGPHQFQGRAGHCWKPRVSFELLTAQVDCNAPTNTAGVDALLQAFDAEKRSRSREFLEGNRPRLEPWQRVRA